MMRSMMFLAFIFMLAGCKKADDTGPKVGETKLGPKGETILSSASLTQEYSTDPAAFDKKFANKMVIVEGEIAWDSMKDTETGRELLPLAGFDNKSLVRCVRTGSFADQVQGLKAGRKVTVRGRAQPYEEGHPDPVLTECDLVSK
jgi:putative nucleic acid binding protein